MTPEEQKKLDFHLIDAAQQGHTETVQKLLGAGADVHAAYDYALRFAAENGHTETVKILLAVGANVHEWDDWALRSAAENGHTETVKILLANGADVHAWDDCALRWAAGHGHAETVKLLQEAIKTEDARRLELERQQNPLTAGTGLTFLDSRPEDLDALLREAIAEQSFRAGRPSGRGYLPLPCP